MGLRRLRWRAAPKQHDVACAFACQPLRGSKAESAEASGHGVGRVALQPRGTTLGDDDLAGVLALAHETKCVFGPLDGIKLVRQRMERPVFAFCENASETVAHRD